MLARIANPSWLALLTRFGIAQPPPFDLDSVVRPVVIVDSSIPILVTPVDVLRGTPASAGELVNPAVGTRLADTGALAAGNWSFFVVMSVSNNAEIRMRRRNAADAADVWSFMAHVPTYNTLQFVFRSIILANERLVLELAAGVATQQGSIFATQD